MLTSVTNVLVKRVINILGEVERDVSDFFDDDVSFKRVSHVTGIKKTTQFASQSILEPFAELGAKYFENTHTKDEVVAVVVVSQTREKLLPNTSIVLAERIGLPNSTVCIDLPFGCSGFGNGLYHSSLLSKNLKGTVLLFLGDNITHFLGSDNTLLPIFGDAASLVEICHTSNFDEKIFFDIFSDGSGREDIQMEGSIFNNSNFKLSMNGTNVLTFAINQAPKSVNRLVDYFDIDTSLVSGIYLHQANKFVVEKVSSRINFLDKSIIFNDCSETGNTGPASIPVLMERIHGKNKLNGFILTCGFGVGWSVCSAYFNVDNLQII